MPMLCRKHLLPICALLIALLCLAPALGGAAGELLAPVTPKPWLVPQATDVPATGVGDAGGEGYLVGEGEPAATAFETATPTPWPQEQQGEAAFLVGGDAQPTATPPLTLPGILGLGDATRMRVLLIGTDAYKASQRGRSDTMVLLQVDVAKGDIRLVSFLRDLYVQIPGHGKTRLNAAYVYGGEALLLATLRKNFGVTADRTLAVNFSRMVELIDRIGGVAVDVSEKERKQLNSILKFYNTYNGFKRNDQLLEQAGTVTLSGKQALCYSRIRKIDSDFERTARQRKVLIGIFERVRAMDPLALASILTQSYDMVSTDLTLPDIAALVPVLMRLENATFESLTIPTKGGYSSQTINGSDVLVPDLAENSAQIEAFLQ